jgi:hypothetical protein
METLHLTASLPVTEVQLVLDLDQRQTPYDSEKYVTRLEVDLDHQLRLVPISHQEVQLVLDQQQLVTLPLGLLQDHEQHRLMETAHKPQRDCISGLDLRQEVDLAQRGHQVFTITFVPLLDLVLQQLEILQQDCILLQDLLLVLELVQFQSLNFTRYCVQLVVQQMVHTLLFLFIRMNELLAQAEADRKRRMVCILGSGRQVDPDLEARPTLRCTTIYVLQLDLVRQQPAIMQMACISRLVLLQEVDLDLIM